MRRWVMMMMTSSNGNIFRVTGPLCGEFTGPGDFPTQRPVTWSFDVFFDLRLNKRLSKQPCGWWFETPSWSLWRQCNVMSEHSAYLTPLSDHNLIIYIPSQQIFDMCKILLWSDDSSLIYNNDNFHQVSNAIEISSVELIPIGPLCCCSD